MSWEHHAGKEPHPDDDPTYIFTIYKYSFSLTPFKSQNEREAHLSSYLPSSYFWCSSSTSHVQCLPLTVRQYGTSVLQWAAGWWVTFLRFLLGTVSTFRQCFCSSCGPEPTTRGQQDSSNGVSAQRPHLQEACQHATRNGWADGLFKHFRNIHLLLLTPVRACLPASGVTPWGNSNKYFTHTHTLLKPTHHFHAKKKEILQMCKWIMLSYFCLSEPELINSLWINYVAWSLVLNQS